MSTRPTATEASRIYARHVGPRGPGGIYHSALLGYDYVVLNVLYGPAAANQAGRNAGWSLIIQPHGAEEPCTHVVPWDCLRDKVLMAPIELSAGERVLVIQTNDRGPQPVPARPVGPGLLIYLHAANAENDTAEWWLVHHSGYSIAAFPTSTQAEAAASMLGLLTDWSNDRAVVGATVDPFAVGEVIGAVGGVLLTNG
jgi:hypothetical protein